MAGQLFATKPLSKILAEAESTGEHRLKRVLGPVQLTALGIGAVIGAGIFVATGEAARNVAGPALMLSYVVAGITCIFAALCYAEFASMVPVAGSAYTYSYATLGELFAWIIGWDLVLEYAVGAATVANGWSEYFQAVLAKLDLHVPASMNGAPWSYANGVFTATSSYINLPAVIVVAVVTAVLVKGIQESARFNAVMVFIKLFTVLFVILVGAFYVKPENWTNDFAPFGWLRDASSGAPRGMLAGASIIFFAYIGFDAVSTQAEEAKNPKRDIPIGIIASLLVCTVLYVGVVAVLTGMVNFKEIDPGAGVSSAFKTAGLPWADGLIAAAGVAGITSVLLVMMMSAPRVFLAMARDGLLPTKFFAAIHPTFRTPWKATILVGVFVAAMAGFLPLAWLLHLTNIGTLLAFIIVCTAVLVMRRTNPQTPRPFRCPMVPLFPILGILMCFMLMASLPLDNWYRLGGWLLIGLAIYFGYGIRHSHLRKANGGA